MYYEFMCFDVPKVVWNPGYDEESRNGRDVKIDILDDYIRTSERFRVIRVFLGYRGVTGIRGRSNGPHGPSGGREEAGRAAPLAQTKLDQGAGPPFLLFLPLLPSPSPPSFPPPSRSRKEGSPTPTSRRIPPPWRATKGWPASPLLLYIRWQGAPLDTQVDLFQPCAVPPPP